MSFASVTLPAAAIRWALSGPAGPAIDALVMALVGAGVDVEPIDLGTRYRLRGPTELLSVLADELKNVEGFALGHEMPPADSIAMRSELAPSHPYRRSVTVHGARAASFIARAVDARLSVVTIGVDRFRVSGRSAALLEWLAAIYCRSAEDVMALFGWTAESVAAEDQTPTVAVTLPPIQVAVSLPDRKTTSEVSRNADGEIVKVVSLEVDV